jgi:hypothetical protein
MQPLASKDRVVLHDDHITRNSLRNHANGALLGPLQASDHIDHHYQLSTYSDYKWGGSAPAASAVELGLAGVQRCAAAGAFVDAVIFVLVVLAATRGLGALLS